jgi:hypothetical protein
MEVRRRSRNCTSLSFAVKAILFVSTSTVSKTRAVSVDAGFSSRRSGERAKLQAGNVHVLLIGGTELRAHPSARTCGHRDREQGGLKNVLVHHLA